MLHIAPANRLGAPSTIMLVKEEYIPAESKIAQDDHMYEFCNTSVGKILNKIYVEH